MKHKTNFSLVNTVILVVLSILLLFASSEIKELRSRQLTNNYRQEAIEFVSRYNHRGIDTILEDASILPPETQEFLYNKDEVFNNSNFIGMNVTFLAIVQCEDQGRISAKTREGRIVEVRLNTTKRQIEVGKEYLIKGTVYYSDRYEKYYIIGHDITKINFTRIINQDVEE